MKKTNTPPKRTNEDIRSYIDTFVGLDEEEAQEILLFESPSYASAFVGLTMDNQAVYDYDKMVAELVREDGMTEEDAMEFIDYNTVRALDYPIPGKKMPILLYPVLDDAL